MRDIEAFTLKSAPFIVMSRFRVPESSDSDAEVRLATPMLLSATAFYFPSDPTSTTSEWTGPCLTLPESENTSSEDEDPAVSSETQPPAWALAGPPAARMTVADGSSSDEEKQERPRAIVAPSGWVVGGEC